MGSLKGLSHSLSSKDPFSNKLRLVLKRPGNHQESCEFQSLELTKPILLLGRLDIIPYLVCHFTS